MPLMDVIKCRKRSAQEGRKCWVLRPTCALGKGASRKINKVCTWLAKCASRAQAKCALKSTPDRIVRTLLTPFMRA
jgi:hypothetical protein